MKILFALLFSYLPSLLSSYPFLPSVYFSSTFLSRPLRFHSIFESNLMHSNLYKQYNRLSAKIISLQKQVEKGRREAGLEGRTKTIVSEALMRAKDDLRLSSSMYTRLSEELAEHRQDAKDRQALWKSKLEQNAKTIKSYFHKYLQKKGFEGKVVFKHRDKTLHLECQTDNTNEATKVKDVRQLSGGERSYTTLCLLLALGHVVS